MFFFSLSLSRSEKSIIGSRGGYSSNGIFRLLPLSRTPPIDRSFMPVIIFTQHAAVQCVALAHLIFLKQQLLVEGGGISCERKLAISTYV